MNKYKSNWLKWCRRFLLALALLGILYVRLRYPLAHWELIKENAARYELEPALIYAVIHTESKFNADAVSPKGARGLMQLIPPTADWAAEKMRLEGYSYENILEPALNIEIGCWYLSRALQNNGGDRTLALASYNAGSGNVAKWLANETYSADGRTLSYIPFEETRNYVRRVNVNYKIYSILIPLYKHTERNS